MYPQGPTICPIGREALVGEDPIIACPSLSEGDPVHSAHLHDSAAIFSTGPEETPMSRSHIPLRDIPSLVSHIHDRWRQTLFLAFAFRIPIS